MSFNELNVKDELKIKIAYYRKKSGLTQSEVAEKMGMSRSSYAYAETRAISLSDDFLAKLAKVLGVSPSVFEEKQLDIKTELTNKPSVPTDAFVTTQKEQRMLKMLRMMPAGTFDEYYNNIRNDYEKIMDEDD